MVCAAHVNVNLQMRIFLDKGAGGAGVIEMNVGEQNGLQVWDGTVANSELLTKILESRSGARIDERSKIPGPQQRGGNGTRPALPIQIQRGDGIHRRKNSVTQRNRRMEKMALRQSGRGVRGSSRKRLQNDELVEYALGHCGWCPSVPRDPREIQSQYRPLKRKNTCALRTAMRLPSSAAGSLKVKTHEIHGFIRIEFREEYYAQMVCNCGNGRFVCSATLCAAERCEHSK